MTIAIGFKCTDGIVLCTDSLESDGVTKRKVDKIYTYQVAKEWGFAVACAGEADLADTFARELPQTLVDGEFDRDKTLLRIRTAISAVRKSYPKSDLAMLFGLYAQQSLNHPMLTCELFRNLDGSEHLGPVTGFQSIGIGGHLSDFLIKNIYQKTMKIEDAVKLGIFAIGQAIEHVDACGGPIQVVAHRLGEWHWTSMSQAEVDRIGATYRTDDLQTALRKYWSDSK
jgi:20S proteasome alpha/beta subunit